MKTAWYLKKGKIKILEKWKRKSTRFLYYWKGQLNRLKSFGVKTGRNTILEEKGCLILLNSLSIYTNKFMGMCPKTASKTKEKSRIMEITNEINQAMSRKWKKIDYVINYYKWASISTNMQRIDEKQAELIGLTLDIKINSRPCSLSVCQSVSFERRGELKS